MAATTEQREHAARATACAWCEQPFDTRAVHLAGRIQCAACAVATTSPWPSDDELRSAYEGWYRPGSGRFAGPGDALLARSRGALARRLDRIAPAGPVLDVGAGDGTLVRALEARGREAVGLEREATAPGLRAAEITEVDGSWAAVVFWHSLEHLRAPGRALDHAARLLAPGGVLAVAVPNAASLQAHAFGDRWFGLDVPRHLVHVPAPALVARLRRAGLDVSRVSHVRGGQVLYGWVHGLVGALPGHPSLYDAIRRPQARAGALSPTARAAVLTAGALAVPGATLASAVEIGLRRGGTGYVEARRG